MSTKIFVLLIVIPHSINKLCPWISIVLFRISYPDNLCSNIPRPSRLKPHPNSLKEDIQTTRSGTPIKKQVKPFEERYNIMEDF